MPFVKLDCKILQSTLWLDTDARWIFITALLMARPWYTDVELPQLCVNKLQQTGWNVPAGAYGLVEAAGPCIAHEAGMNPEQGLKALERLGAPDEFSRSEDFQGRRLVRVNHGYLVLNYMHYRETRDEDVKRQYMRDYMANRRSDDPEYGRKPSKNKGLGTTSDGKLGLTPGKPMLAKVGAVSPRLAQAEAEAEAEGATPPPRTRVRRASPPQQEPRHVRKKYTLDHRAKKSARRSDMDSSFMCVWGCRPKRSGADPKEAAYRAWLARVKEGIPAETLLAGFKRYQAWCESTGKCGTQYVMRTANFFGPDHHFDEPWDLPAEKGKGKSKEKKPWITGVYDCK